MTLTRNRTRWELAEKILYVRSATRLLNKTQDLDWDIKAIPDAGGWDDDGIVVGDEEGEAKDEMEEAPAVEEEEEAEAEEVDEREDDLEPDSESDDDAASPIAEHLAPIAERLCRLEDEAPSRIAPRDEAPSADPKELELRKSRARQRPARYC